MQASRIGYMPCNPAVGGLAKGHLVKELDALGGEIGRVTDQAGIQFRMLNRGKGPAVWSPRAQVDKVLYSETMRNTVKNQVNLAVVEGEVACIKIERERFREITFTDGTTLTAPACVLTTGTFLRGLMHVGDTKILGGREGGLNDDTLKAIIDGTAVSDQRIAVIVDAAGRLVETKGALSDDERADFHNRGLNDGDLIEIIGEIAHCTLTNYMNRLAQTDLDGFLATVKV